MTPLNPQRPRNRDLNVEAILSLIESRDDVWNATAADVKEIKDALIPLTATVNAHNVDIGKIKFLGTLVLAVSGFVLTAVGWVAIPTIAHSLSPK